MFNKAEVSTIIKALAFFQANLDQEMIDEALEDNIEILTDEAELSQLEIKVESTLTNSEKDFNFTLLDEVNDDSVTGSINTNGDLGVALYFDGFGDCCHQDNSGTPVYIEKYDGEVIVRIYGDINNEEPTHNISLEGARLENRSS
jgi:hypothetical protein